MTTSRADWLLFLAIHNTEDAYPIHALQGTEAEWDRLIRGGFVSVYRDPWRAGAPRVEPRGFRLRGRLRDIRNRQAGLALAAGARP